MSTSRSVPSVDQLARGARRRSCPDRSVPRLGRRRRPCRGPPRPSIRHTPVRSSPARIARSTGAAPRHRGSSEKWRFTIGSAVEQVRLDDPAVRDDDAEVGVDVDEQSSGSAVTASPSSSAAALTGLGDVCLPRPRRLSAPDTTSDDLVPGVVQRPQRWHRHLRGAEVDEPQRSSKNDRLDGARFARRGRRSRCPSASPGPPSWPPCGSRRRGARAAARRRGGRSRAG